ncbi:hypothetical protein DFJ77DRAFT_304997 [Powellomyces hirtus]|nr:hypothetical protein DFJ77DRAFT_304997 [Powellomyces hirtus]
MPTMDGYAQRWHPPNSAPRNGPYLQYPPPPPPPYHGYLYSPYASYYPHYKHPAEPGPHQPPLPPPTQQHYPLMASPHYHPPPPRAYQPYQMPPPSAQQHQQQPYWNGCERYGPPDRWAAESWYRSTAPPPPPLPPQQQPPIQPPPAPYAHRAGDLPPPLHISGAGSTGYFAQSEASWSTPPEIPKDTGTSAKASCGSSSHSASLSERPPAPAPEPSGRPTLETLAAVATSLLQISSNSNKHTDASHHDLHALCPDPDPPQRRNSDSYFASDAAQGGQVQRQNGFVAVNGDRNSHPVAANTSSSNSNAYDSKWRAQQPSGAAVPDSSAHRVLVTAGPAKAAETMAETATSSAISSRRQSLDSRTSPHSHVHPKQLRPHPLHIALPVRLPERIYPPLLKPVPTYPSDHPRVHEVIVSDIKHPPAPPRNAIPSSLVGRARSGQFAFARPNRSEPKRTASKRHGPETIDLTGDAPPAKRRLSETSAGLIPRKPGLKYKSTGVSYGGNMSAELAARLSFFDSQRLRYETMYRDVKTDKSLYAQARNLLIGYLICERSAQNTQTSPAPPPSEPHPQQQPPQPYPPIYTPHFHSHSTSHQTPPQRPYYRPTQSYYDHTPPHHHWAQPYRHHQHHLPQNQHPQQQQGYAHRPPHAQHQQQQQYSYHPYMQQQQQQQPSYYPPAPPPVLHHR